MSSCMSKSFCEMMRLDAACKDAASSLDAASVLYIAMQACEPVFSLAMEPYVAVLSIAIEACEPRRLIGIWIDVGLDVAHVALVTKGPTLGCFFLTCTSGSSNTPPPPLPRFIVA